MNKEGVCWKGSDQYSLNRTATALSLILALMTLNSCIDPITAVRSLAGGATSDPSVRDPDKKPRPQPSSKPSTPVPPPRPKPSAKPSPTITPKPSPTVTPKPSPTPPTPTKACSEYPHLKPVPVSTADELEDALKNAREGDLIQLADGVYQGNFVATAKGDSSQPITLCGSSNAILDAGGLTKGYVLHLNGVSYWNIVGLTVRNGAKGVMLDNSTRCVLDKLTVHNIGDEAVHLRKNSSHNVLKNSSIHHIGLKKPQFGEGVYLGSSKNNMVNDKSDYNQILNNHIGPNVAAESIDIKEYSTGGLIEGNTLDGTGQKGENSGNKLINAKGNGYMIRGNHGMKPLEHGFTVHVLVPGGPSGNDNVFENNVLDDVPGLGFYIAKEAKGNIVKCNNSVSATAGFGNVDCVH